jgi:hypothetical protein
VIRRLGDQSLKAKPTFDGSTRSPEIIVDDDDGLSGPSQLKGPVDQCVLQPR